MTRDVLEAYIAQGLHQSAIAAAAGVTDAAVFIQLRRHGLRAPDGHGRNRAYTRRERIKFGGYWMLYRPEHPRADKRGRIMEHRLVVEAREGRYLTPTEVVHHMNHVKDDNRPENLMLLPDKAAHSREHHPRGKPVAQGGNEARWGK